MAVTTRKKPLVGNRGFVVDVYENEISTGEPIVSVTFRDALYDALDAGSKTAVEAEIVAATMIAAAYTN